MLANRTSQVPDLPITFRGYDRDAIDQFLEEVEGAYADLGAERDELRDQVARLTRDLEHYRQHEDQAKEALARAEQVAAGLKVQAERETEEQRTTLERELVSARSTLQHELEEGRAALERERQAAEAESAEILRRAELGRSGAQAEADAIVHGARAEAERLTHELTARASAQSQAAERVLDDTRARLAAMVTDLIRQLPVGTAGTPGARPPA